MLERVRLAVSAEGVSVSVFQRTQIIASNRLVAKVDPTASSTLNLAAKETNALDEVLQLTQLVAQVQSGGVLTALGGLQKTVPQEKIDAFVRKSRTFWHQYAFLKPPLSPTSRMEFSWRVAP